MAQPAPAQLWDMGFSKGSGRREKTSSESTGPGINQSSPNFPFLPSAATPTPALIPGQAPTTRTWLQAFVHGGCALGSTRPMYIWGLAPEQKHCAWLWGGSRARGGCCCHAGSARGSVAACGFQHATAEPQQLLLPSRCRGGEGAALPRCLHPAPSGVPALAPMGAGSIRRSPPGAWQGLGCGSAAPLRQLPCWEPLGRLKAQHQVSFPLGG